MELTKKPPTSARNKMMALLSRREYSEREMRAKLEGQFSTDEIDQAINFGKEKKWLPSNANEALALAENFAEVLRRKGKGTDFINQYLEKKGLPSITSSAEDELTNIQQIISKKFPQFYTVKTSVTYDEYGSAQDFQKEQLQAKIARFLISRGFNSEIVRKVLYDNSAE